MSEENTYILQNIRKLIDDWGLKHSKIANDIGMSKSNFSSMLVGKKILRAEYLPGIAKSIGCSYNDLFRRPDQSADERGGMRCEM